VSSAARLTSTASDRVKAVRSLHSRSGRRKAARFLVEGPQAVRSALDAGVVIHDLFVADDAGVVHADLLADARASGVRVTEASTPVLTAMGETEHPQGVLAVCGLLPSVPLGDLMARPGPVVVLEELADPGNVGTVIRTADAVGAAGVVLTPGSADVHNGKVVRSTAGSLFHLPIAPGIGLEDLVAAVRAAGRTLAVTTGQGATDLFAAAADGLVHDRTCWLIGSEAHGASPSAIAAADLLVRIPMTGRAESLNAAVAAAAVLYVTAFDQAQRARSAGGGGFGLPAD
jgi:TrmH family RNA methyltransferase